MLQKTNTYLDEILLDITYCVTDIAFCAILFPSYTMNIKHIINIFKIVLFM